MRSLDKFYKYIENREAGETSVEKPPTCPAPTLGSRYVIRNGVTVAVPITVPREQAAATQFGPVPKDDVIPQAHEEAAPEVLPSTDSLAGAGKIWQSLPENVRRLAQLSVDIAPDAAVQTPERRQLIERLLNPLISLEDTARLLGVCTATVRRYANKGSLAHQRTVGQQRRFLLSDVLALLESRKPSSQNADISSEEVP